MALTKKGNEKKLKEIGVRDSKLLSPRRREELAKEIKKICKVYIKKIPATKINYLMRSRINLNQIEAISVTELIKRAIKAVKSEEIETFYIDCPDPTTKKFLWRMEISDELKKKINAGHKYDVLFPIVSAASIVAKVRRDKEVENIKNEFNFDLGTGYTHDEKAIEFIKKFYKDPRIKRYLRSEWITTKELLKKLKFKTKQIKLDEF